MFFSLIGIDLQIKEFWFSLLNIVSQSMPHSASWEHLIFEIILERCLLTNSWNFVDCFSNWLTCCLFFIFPVLASCACQFHVLCLMNFFSSVFSYDVLLMKLVFSMFYYVQFYSSPVHNTTLSISCSTTQ